MRHSTEVWKAVELSDHKNVSFSEMKSFQEIRLVLLYANVYFWVFSNSESKKPPTVVGYTVASSFVASEIVGVTDIDSLFSYVQRQMPEAFISLELQHNLWVPLTRLLGE